MGYEYVLPINGPSGESFTEVFLTVEEQHEAIRIGKARHEAHVPRNKNEKAFKGQDLVLPNNILGTLGEKAVRKALGILEPPALYEKGGDGGVGDIYLPSINKTASVKTPSKFYVIGTYFWYNVPSTLEDDFGILCTPYLKIEHVESIRLINILGWTTREYYQRNKKPIPVPYGKAEGITHYEMEPFSTFIKLVTCKEW